MNAALREADLLYKAHVPTCSKCQRGEAGLSDGMVTLTHGCPEMRRIFRLLREAQKQGPQDVQARSKTRKPRTQPHPHQSRVATNSKTEAA